MISVVLSSYNGEHFIEEQLDSILKQTVKPDEVIISDDCSTDDTVKVVSEYIKNNGLSNWCIHTNRDNLGWKKNFRKVLEEANGDYIFLCDQDDVWMEDKIESMVSIMKNDRNILLLASNYKILSEGDSGRFDVIKQSENDSSVEKLPFNTKNFYIHRPGCVYCVRKSLITYFDEYSFDDYPHDAFLWRIASLLDGLYIYRRPTILYRRHGENATGHEHRNVESKLITMDYYARAVESMGRFINKEKVVQKEEKIKILNRISSWIVLRTDFLKTGKIKLWFKLVGYRDCYWGMKTLLSDFLMAKKIIR